MKRLLFLLTLCLMLVCAHALAVPARILTPGGKLNMRKTDSDKAKIVTQVPNHALVEVHQVGVTWSEITYKSKTGFVQNSFLLLPENMLGQTVYPDEDHVFLFTEQDAWSDVCGILGAQDAVTVLEVDGSWLKVAAKGLEGWTSCEGYTYQYTQMQGAPSWIALDGMIAQDTILTGLGGKETPLALGETVHITMLEDTRAFVQVRNLWGYVPQSAIAISLAEESWKSSSLLSPTEASAKAKTTLGKQYKAYGKETLYTWVAYDSASALYTCLFLSEDDQVRYGAIVDPASGKVVYTASYTSFATPLPASSLLASGEMLLTLSCETLNVGEVIDFSVEAWTHEKCAWNLTKDGAPVMPTREGTHLTAAFRPKASGTYTVSVLVTDRDGLSQTRSATFTVLDTPGDSGLERVYSQKDGWWLDKAYRKSTLDQSGCAIFTLSHALQRLGIGSEDILPENLAKTYALCLTVDGTNNERLIQEASQVYGYHTQKALIEQKSSILSYLRADALFSFSIARGHIALIDGVSDDGTMVHIVDSAPSATYERIVNTAIYIEKRSGLFRQIRSLDDVPGARWYLDTDAYGGLEYWMPIEYAAKRGVRLIEMP